MLDGWRGLAAIFVVLDHAVGLHWGHWAVLVFFIISGYCISASTDSCRRKGLTALEFMKRRVRRIYPPYALALLFFLATRALKSWQTHINQFTHWSPLQYLQNFSMTQWVSLLFHPSSRAFANPTLMVPGFWTLNYEEQFYLLMGIFLLIYAYRRIPMAGYITALGLAGVLWCTTIGSLCYGLFLDYFAVFALGAAVYFRLTKLQTKPARYVFDGALLLLTLALAAYTYYHPSDPVGVLRSSDHRAEATEWLVGAVFSLILITFRSRNDQIMGTKAGIVLAFLGTISYSLYLVNQFNLVFVEAIIHKLLPLTSPFLLIGGITLALHLVIATVFWWCCERPFLNKPLEG
jgi:peptidoglycan/LPS O-acetylase OafA/YrhL